MAAEYDRLTGEPAFAADGTRWLGNVLGANAWGESMVIGDGSSFPHCPSHQLANLAGSLDGSPPVLAGGVVEGPSDESSSGEVEGMRACPAAGGNPFARFNGSGAVFADDVAVVHHGGAGDRPDGQLDARLRLAGRDAGAAPVEPGARAPNRIGRSGRVAQWESARFTRERSQVRNPPRPLGKCLVQVSGVLSRDQRPAGNSAQTLIDVEIASLDAANAW